MVSRLPKNGLLSTLSEDNTSGLVNGSPAFNEEVKRKLGPSQSFDNAQPAASIAKFADLRYTKFDINGFPGDKHAVFIPDNLTLSPSVLEQICSALDREMPSMFLTGVSSLCHPTKMSTTQLRKCPGFAPLMTEVRNSLGLQTKPGEASRDTDTSNKRLVEVADHVLEKKIASTVSNIASAAFRTNVWMYSGPQISNFEIFLQQYIENGETDAFRMVAAHMQDKSYMESMSSKQLMKDLFDSSQVMSPEAVYFARPLHLQGDLWDPTCNRANPEFSEHGYDYWSFDSLDQKMISGHPITQWPWPHANLFLLFYHEENITGAAQADVDWEFSTKMKLDEEAVLFSPETVAPVGYIFIGAPYCWQPQMKRKLLHSIKLANPLVVIDNTPNVSKQISVFVKAIRKVWDKNPLSACRPFLSNERGAVGGSPTAQDLIQAMSPAKLMKHVEREFDSSGMNADERLTLSDIVGLLDLVKRRPQVFKETVCAVDPLTDSAESTITQLMSVFTSQHNCSKEFNSTDVHRSLVLRGWDLHLRLVRRATHLRRFATAMVFLIASLMLLSTTLAMIRIWLKFHNVLYDEEAALSQLASPEPEAPIPYERLLNIALVVLPITVLLLLTIQGSFQIAQSWANVHMGASRVVAEIYYFLGSIPPYDQLPAVNQRRFLKRLRDMVKRLSVSGLSGVREEDLVTGSAGPDQATSADLETLQQQVQQSLYGVEPLWYPCRKVKDAMQACLGGSSWGSFLLATSEHKDLTAPVTAEMYFDIRMMPLKKHYSDMVRASSRLRMLLHCALMLVICISVGLGATDGFSIWIPVSLGLATFVTTLTHWLTPPEVMAAINGALTTLQKLDLRWQGSDIRENRSEATKQRLITATERMVLAVERATSRATAVPEADDEERDIDDGEREDGMDSKQNMRSRPISVAVTPLNLGSGAQTPLGLAHARGMQDELMDDNSSIRWNSRKRH
jgi:hypothetical protein